MMAAAKHPTALLRPSPASHKTSLTRLLPSLPSAASAAAALFLSLLCAPFCDFAALSIQVYDPAGNPLLQTRLGFGLWRHQIFEIVGGGLQIEDSCTYYDEDVVSVDPAWAAARAFGCLAPIIGGLNLLYLCWHYWRAWLSAEAKSYALGVIQSRIIGAVFVVVAFYQGLTLLFLRSSVCKTNPSAGLPSWGAEEVDEFHEWLESTVEPAIIEYSERCTMSTGANLTIGCTLCWFVAGVLSCAVHPPTRPGSVQDDVAACAPPDERNDGEELDLAEKGEEEHAVALDDGQEDASAEEQKVDASAPADTPDGGEEIDGTELAAKKNEEERAVARDDGQEVANTEEQKDQVSEGENENQTETSQVDQQNESEQTVSAPTDEADGGEEERGDLPVEHEEEDHAIASEDGKGAEDAEGEQKMQPSNVEEEQQPSLQIEPKKEDEPKADHSTQPVPQPNQSEKTSTQRMAKPSTQGKTQKARAKPQTRRRRYRK
ncbi:hypothetical protein ACHAXT_002028 [Thalassiosira profunda]